MTTPRLRRLAAGTVLLFSVSALGACDFTLGNGDEANCSAEAVDDLITRFNELSDRLTSIDHQLETQANLSDLDRLLLQLERPGVVAELDAAEAALDACDAAPAG